MSDDAKLLAGFDPYGLPDQEMGATSEGTRQQQIQTLEESKAARDGWTPEKRRAMVARLAESGLDAEHYWADAERRLQELKAGVEDPADIS